MTDNVEQVAMIAGGSIGPFTGWAFLAIDQTDLETAPRCVVDIADQPVTPLPAPVRQIAAAYRLGLLAKAAG